MGHYRIKLPDGGEISEIDLEPLSDGRYRALEHPLLTDAFGLHDILECDEGNPSFLRIVRVVERGPWRTLCFGLSQTMMDSTELGVELDQLIVRGGNWDRVFGGMLFIHIPRCRFRTVGYPFVRWIRRQGWGRNNA